MGNLKLVVLCMYVTVCLSAAAVPNKRDTTDDESSEEVCVNTDRDKMTKIARSIMGDIFVYPVVLDSAKITSDFMGVVGYDESSPEGDHKHTYNPNQMWRFFLSKLRSTPRNGYRVLNVKPSLRNKNVKMDIIFPLNNKSFNTNWVVDVDCEGMVSKITDISPESVRKEYQEAMDATVCEKCVYDRK